MTITPVVSTSLDAIGPEPNPDAPASGFDTLLAGARAASSHAAKTSKPKIDEPDGNEEPAANDTTDATDGAADTSDSGVDDASDGRPVSAPGTAHPGKPNAPATDANASPPVAAPPGTLTGTPPVLTPPPATPPDAPAGADRGLKAGAPAPEASAVAIAKLAELAAERPGPPGTGETPAGGTEKAEPLNGDPPPTPDHVPGTTHDPALGAPALLNAAGGLTKNDSGKTVDVEPAATGAQGAAAEHARPLTSAPVAPVAPANAEAASTALVANQPLTTPATEATVVEQIATAAPAAAPPPAEQLVSVLTPLRTTSNGTYTLRLELKPPELGRVEMRVDMKDGVMHASIHSDHEGSAQLLRDALGELRDRLDAANVRTGELTVSDGGVGARDHGGANAQSRGDLTALADPTNPADPSAAAAAAGGDLDTEATSLLDVRV